jgi:hypothetical protein
VNCPRIRLASGLALLFALSGARACELCAIYNAGNVTGETDSGLIFTLSEQYIPYNVTLFNGREVSLSHPDYLNASITHLVPGYNFSSRFGINLNIPLEYYDFRRTDIRYSTTAPPVVRTEKGGEFGLGDLALIGRATVFQYSDMHRGLIVNLLSGVKFPTGDARRIDDEVQQSLVFQSLLPPGTPHDPLSHSISSVHQHQLALGSGSYDGVFALIVNSRYDRFFANGQFQYYLRTHGEENFKFGDEIIITGGPGAFLFLERTWTLSVAVNGTYDSMGRDELIGKVSDRTGSTEWFVGPYVYFSFGTHFTANAGVDLPLYVTNHGFQSLPEYQVRGGVTWRF